MEILKWRLSSPLQISEARAVREVKEAKVAAVTIKKMTTTISLTENDRKRTITKYLLLMLIEAQLEICWKSLR
jgi:hypothetical protein